MSSSEGEENPDADGLGASTPHLYANGFGVALGVGDISTPLLFGPNTVAVLTMSLPVAKTYARAIDEVLKRYEEKTGQVVPDMKEIIEKARS